MLSKQHGTTINIVRHWMGAYVGALSRKHLAGLCPIRELHIAIPCWKRNEVCPWEPAPIEEVLYKGGETAIVVWVDGAFSLVPVAADGLVYGHERGVRKQEAVLLGRSTSYMVDVSACTGGEPPKQEAWTVSRAIDRAEDRFEGIRRMTRGWWGRPLAAAPQWAWIDPDPRAWDRTIRARRKVSPTGVTTISVKRDDDNEPRKPRLTEWGKRVLATARRPAPRWQPVPAAAQKPTQPPHENGAPTGDFPTAAWAH